MAAVSYTHLDVYKRQVLNLPLCIIVNAIALFWIACLLIDEYNPNNYFPAGMALIFFQIAPVHTVSDLGNRLLALLASFGIVFLFAWFLSLNTTVQNRLKALISDGFDVCKELLAQTGCITADSHSAQNETSEQVPELHKKLCTINQHISREIYSANRATPVSYTHLDVYKRQQKYRYTMSDSTVPAASHSGKAACSAAPASSLHIPGLPPDTAVP